MGKPLVFVQVSAYRDQQLKPTLESLFDEASAPDQLRVTICWQHARTERLPRVCTTHHIEVIDVDYRRSRGANWARRHVQKRWRGEPYSLIIDSHLRFAPHWDSMLVDMFQKLKTKGARKPAVTCYPPNFDPVTFPKGRSHVPLKIYKEKYYEGLLAHFAGVPLPFWRWLTEPIPAQFLALGFLFTEGSFNTEIPIDPAVYFFGDEITTGLRAYCHGYDLFHPHRVIAWHAYDRATRRCHWLDHDDWRCRDQRSLRHVRRVLKGEFVQGYPLGTVRTIADYERYIGLSLISKNEDNKCGDFG
ncbi:MAG: hypothetical protein JSR20_18300 [Nitrospira sp.]|nr:hypothetical protein [Nitrospira sp.]